MRKILMLIISLFILNGCAHVISEQVRKQADQGLTFEVILKDPDSYKGRKVILGGVIISSNNADEGTYIEVLQKPTGKTGRPKDTDISRGRFIIFNDGYLDKMIYSKGKEITVAGEISGKMIQLLDETRYSYPLIKSIELHIHSSRPKVSTHFSIGVYKSF